MNTDYALLMIRMEKHMRELHDACLQYKWHEATSHAKHVDSYCDALIEWLRDQKEGVNGEFKEVRVLQPE